MTYATSEASEQDGAPVEAYKFAMGATTWLHTSAAESQVVLGDTYTAVAGLRRSEIVSGDPDEDGAIDVTLPTSNALAALFLGDHPGTTVDLTIYRAHRSEPTEVAIIWMGEVVRVTGVEAGEATLHCEPLLARLARKIPRHRVGRLCSSTYADPNMCQLDPDLGAHTNTVSAVSGRTITVTGLGAVAGASGLLVKAGIVEFGDYTGYIDDVVLDSAGAPTDQLVLLAPIPGLAVSSTVTVKRGCIKTLVACQTHGNQAHRIAWDQMPVRNPYTGGGLQV